jgi:hygromycin-B 4-O-kinase
MTEIKADMDLPAAKAFLQQYWGSTAEDVQTVDQGEVNRVYLFQHQEHNYVIRFNSNQDGFLKERYMVEQFGSQGIPIPRILDIGTVDSGHVYFAISDRASGSTLITYKEQPIRERLPELLDIFARMNQLQLGDAQGYGWIQPTGDAQHGSWSEFLESVYDEHQTGFWQGWYDLFASTHLERDVFERLYGRMMELTKYCPKERYLVHGDFHMGNILSDTHKVTAIIDWEMAMYGDFMFDLATLQLWTPQFQFAESFHAHCRANQIEIPYYEERLRASLLCKGLDALRFFAKKGNEKAYYDIRDRLISVADNVGL